jgi:hypothetical protein
MAVDAVEDDDDGCLTAAKSYQIVVDRLLLLDQFLVPASS